MPQRAADELRRDVPPTDGSDAPSSRFDVFLSYSSPDRPAVLAIAQRLRDEEGLRPFVDRWHLVAGSVWQDELLQALVDSATAAVFIGPSGIASWHHEELRVALNRAVRAGDEFRVIPVLLPGASAAQVPAFLGQRSWVDFSAGLDDVGALGRLAAGIRGEAVDGGGYELPDHPAPYRGLLRFEQTDAPIFFGRDDETRALMERLEARRFVAVVGASGSGKSSLLRAGLLPAVARGIVPGGERWRLLVCRPGPTPLRSLARQVATLTRTRDRAAVIDGLTHRIGQEPAGLWRAVADATADDPQPVLLVIDQLEELFTHCAHETSEPVRCRDTVARFAAALGEAVSVPGGQVRVAITLRADFLDRALQLPTLQRLLGDPILLGPLDDAALREAIVEPAQHVGAMFEKGLVATILRDIGDQHTALPLLQHALLELWRRRRGPWLTLDAYEAIGGLAGALSRRAQRTFDALTLHQQELARMVFLRLIAFGEGVADTRRRVEHEELYPATVDRRQVDDVVQALSSEEARLLVVDHDTVEIAHETLLREWSTLRSWLEADRDAQRVHRRLTQATTEWAERLDRDDGGLYRGARLAEALEWAGDHGVSLNALEREFLDASRTAAADELTKERERNRRLRHRLWATFAALAVAIVGVAAAMIASNEARDATELARSNEAQARNEADRADDNAARALAQQARALAPQRPTLALAVAAEALERAATPQVAEALQVALVAYGRAGWQPHVTFTGHSGLVWAADVAPDGRRVATVGRDGTARIWEAETGAVHTVFRAHAGTVTEVAFAPDGQRVATAGVDRTARVWDADSGAELTVFRGHTGRVSGVAFGPQGRRVATVGEDGTARVWDADTGTELMVFTGHTDWVRDVDFTPDGEHLVTGGSDVTARIWDVATGEEVAVLDGHDDAVRGVDVSHDGSRVATASTDGTARIWDVATGEELVALTGHDGAVWTVAFAPGGDEIATASSDGTAKVWSASTGSVHATLWGHTDSLRGVAFAPVGRRVVTTSADTTARVWGPIPRRTYTELTGHTGPVRDVELAPDGVHAASASSDGTARVWTADTGAELAMLSGHEDSVNGIAYAHDGRRIATASSDRTAKVWDLTTSDEPVTLTGHTAPVRSVAMASDGKRVATASADRTARVWDAWSGRLLTTVRGHLTDVVAVAFASDDHRIATASTAGVAKVWDADTGDELATMRGHTGPVRAVAFGPDGRRIATAGGDGLVRVWDTGTPSATLTMSGHASDVTDVSFSPDGSRLATASLDQTAKVWDAWTGDLITTLEGHTSAVWAVAFSPDGQRIATASVDRTAVIRQLILTPEDACELVAGSVTHHELRAALSGADPQACTGLR